MALGGGSFIGMNKTLPGAYINFVSATANQTVGVDRGVVAIAADLDWGEPHKVTRITQTEFYQNAWKYFGHDYKADELKAFRDLFTNAVAAYVYRLNGSAKATCVYCDAKYAGTAGNNLKIVVAENENSTSSDKIYDVTTYADNVAVDSQIVKQMTDLLDTDYVVWKDNASLSITAGTALTGGSNGTSAESEQQNFLDAIQQYQFNTLACTSENSGTQALYVAFTKRMRDDMGVKFQLVLHGYTGETDHEGIILVKNNTGSELVPWVAGASAACPINESLTNKTYDGEYTVDVNLTQTQLQTALQNGEFVFHRVGDEARVLSDINTLKTFTAEKSSIFGDNQAVRVIDYSGNYIAAIFNTKFLGKVANDNTGRTVLWNEIVNLFNVLQSNGAIVNFESSDVTVNPGETRNSVIASVAIQIAGTMTKLYMTVLVN